MITRFQVQNYKALRDVTLELTPIHVRNLYIHVLIGPNDSGKTSILEAIAALCRSVDHPLEEAFMRDWNGSELVWKNTPDLPISFSMTVKENQQLPFDYHLACTFNPAEHAIGISEEWFRLGRSEVIRFGSGGSVTSGGHTLTSSWVCKNHGTARGDRQRAANRVHSSLSGIHSYHWNPRRLALPVAADANRRFRMDASGFGLALCLDDILGYDFERFAELIGRFREIFPHIKRIRLIPGSAYRSPALEKAHGKGIYFEFESGHELPAAQISDGVLLVLAYLTILYLPPPYQPRVVLVEEPENGIHPKRLQEVLGILRDLVKEQSKTQVILTTHSPYVLDLFAPEEVSLCQMDEEGAVSVRRLSESQTVKEQAKVFTLGEIWTAEGDEALAK